MSVHGLNIDGTLHRLLSDGRLCLLRRFFHKFIAVYLRAARTTKLRALF